MASSLTFASSHLLPWLHQDGSGSGAVCSSEPWQQVSYSHGTPEPLGFTWQVAFEVVWVTCWVVSCNSGWCGLAALCREAALALCNLSLIKALCSGPDRFAGLPSNFRFCSFPLMLLESKDLSSNNSTWDTAVWERAGLCFNCFI